MDYPQIKRRIIFGFAWESATKLIVQVVSWATTIIVARILTPSDYGVVAVSGIFVGLLVVISQMGLAEGLINKKTLSRSEEDAVFWLSMLLAFVIFAILFILAPLIAHFYQMDMLTEIIRVSALVLVLSNVKVVPFALAMRNMDFRYRSLAEMGGNIVMAITVVYLAVTGFGAWSLVWSVLAKETFITLAYLPLLRHIPRMTLQFSKVLGIFAFGFKLMCSRVLEYLTLTSDVFMIGSFLGQQTVGYYSVAYTVSTMPMDKVGTIFNRIAFPAFSRVKDQGPHSRAIFLQMHRYLIMISYPVLLGLALVADDAVSLLLTTKWKAIVPFVQALCIINLLRVSGMLMPYTLAGRGKASLVLAFHVVSAIVLPAAFALGVQWGAYGVIYAWMLAYPPLYLLLLQFMLKELDLGVKIFLNSSKSVLLACIVMTSAVFATRYLLAELPAYARLAVSVAVGIATYVGTFFFFYRGELEEVKRTVLSLRVKSQPNQVTGAG
jgi:O-antigen/teichoic acid export membrane protein